jgi:Xaa-Pro aminopeptidase
VSGDQAGRLARLRDRLAERGVDGLFLPRTDEHGSEYLPACAERVAWLTGFTGSAAQVVVLREQGGRVHRRPLHRPGGAGGGRALFERPHVVSDPPSKWIEANLPEGARLGFDPFLVTRGQRDRIAKAVEAKGGSLVPLHPNPVDEAWDRPPAPPVGRVEAWTSGSQGRPARPSGRAWVTRWRARVPTGCC